VELSESLANVTIDEPFVEKERIERFTWPQYLKKKHGRWFNSTFEFNERIIEVYHLCYGQSTDDKKLDVVNDFVTFHPHLAFRADWLRELVAHQVTELWRAAPSVAAPSALLRTLAKGFTRAAHLRIPRRRWEHRDKLVLAAMFRDVLGEELSEFCRKLTDAVGDWREQESSKKVAELIDLYPALQVAGRMKTLLEHVVNQRSYEASVLIASAVYGLRQRDLQSGMN
jgi:hypothetical protein